MRHDVRLEGSVTEDERQQREKEKRFGGHQKMTGDHQRCAERHRSPAVEPAIGDDSAENGRQIDEACVEPVDLGGERRRGFGRGASPGIRTSADTAGLCP